MSSPAKRRKLNTASKDTPPARGIEYFFSKQKQAPSFSLAAVSTPEVDAQDDKQEQQLTDEEYARKLQEEWNKEAVVTNSHAKDGASRSASIENPENVVEERLSEEDPAAAEIETCGPTDAFPQKNTLSLQSVAAAEDSVSATLSLDQSPLSFDPSRYIPDLQQQWASQGGDASYALLTRCFEVVSSTQSRIKIVDALVNCLRVIIEGDHKSLLAAVSRSGTIILRCIF